MSDRIWTGIAAAGGVKERNHMASSNLTRWCGLAALAGGAVYVLQGIIMLASPQKDPFVSFSDYLIEILNIISILGVLAGIAGLHALQREQRERYGWFGAASSLLAFIGFALQLVASVIFISAGGGVPVGRVVVLIGGLTTLVGVALLGAAILRRRALPLWYGVLFLVGNLVGLVSFEQQGGAILLGIVWGVTGYVLLSSWIAVEQQPTRVN
jgi:hypothetical protein